ncbi:MAG: hypothetical protein WBO69_18595 [Thermoanaerobaculia bacterium]
MIARSERTATVWLVLLLGLLFGGLLTTETWSYQVRLVVPASTTLDWVQFFFAADHEFRGVDSVWAGPTPGSERVVFDATIPSQPLAGLRIDPVSKTDEVSIVALELSARSRLTGTIRLLKRWSAAELASDFAGRRHLGEPDVDGEVLVFEIEGRDPYFYATGASPFWAKNGDRVLDDLEREAWLVRVSGAIVIGLIGALFLWKRDAIILAFTGRWLDPFDRIARKAPTVVVVLAVVWFLVQTVFLATHVLHGIGPDETYHVTLTGMHAETGKLHLADSADTYELGLLSTRPYLYHYLLGTALQTKVSMISWLRMANIILGVFYLLFAWLLALEFSRDRLTAAFTLVILTNVMMLVFLFSMVSYDNLTNLVAAANFFFLVRFFNRQEAWAFWGVMLSVLIGSLTKITYLPLVALQLLLVPFYWKSLKTFFPSLHPGRLNFSQWGMLVLTLCLIAMNVELYGGNLVRYGAVNPKPSEVLDGDSLAVFNTEHDPTSRYAELRATKDSRPAVDLPMFALMYVEAVMRGILAVVSHNGYALPVRVLQLCQAVLLAVALTLLLRFRRLVRHPCFLSMSLICLVYGLVLFAVNYRSYLSHHFFGAALQGRYIFPVLAPMVVLASHALLTGLRDAFKLLVIVVVGSVFVAGAFPTFMAVTDDTWFISDEAKIFLPSSSARPATVPEEWIFAKSSKSMTTSSGPSMALLPPPRLPPCASSAESARMTWPHLTADAKPCTASHERSTASLNKLDSRS